MDNDVDDVTTTSTVEVEDRETRQGDDDDDDDDDDDVQMQQNDTNIPEGFLVHSTWISPEPSDSSTKERMLQHKSNVSDVSQSTGGDGVITKIWRMVKALLKAVKNFWFRTTGGQ